jgi:hypothetical protein
MLGVKIAQNDYKYALDSRFVVFLQQIKNIFKKTTCNICLSHMCHIPSVKFNHVKKL